MFMQQVVIRWLEWGGYVLVGVIVLLDVLFVMLVVHWARLHKNKEYEKALIVLKIIVGIIIMIGILYILLGAMERNNVTLISGIAMIIGYILAFLSYKYTLKRIFLENLVSSCLQKIKELDSTEKSFKVYVFCAKIVIENLATDILVEKPNSFSITLSQAKKLIAKTEGIEVVSGFFENTFIFHMT